jgi:hypothetical protein
MTVQLGRRASAAVVLPVVLALFPAVLRARKLGDEACEVVIGAASDQSILVGYREAGGASRACTRASDAAADVVANLPS